MAHAFAGGASEAVAWAFRAAWLAVGVLSAAMAVAVARYLAQERRRTSILRASWALFGPAVIGTVVLLGSIVRLGTRLSRASGWADVRAAFSESAKVLLLTGALTLPVVGTHVLLDQRKRNRNAAKVLEGIREGKLGPKPLLLYLRPFEAVPSRTEDIVIHLFEERCDLFTVDEPGFKSGMGRVKLRKGEWNGVVVDVGERAAVIVMYPAESDGAMWELEEIKNRSWLDRTLFVMPPSESRERPRFLAPLLVARSRRGVPALSPAERAVVRDGKLGAAGVFWDRARRSASRIDVRLPPYRGEGGVFRIAGNAVEWVGSLGSYRPGAEPDPALPGALRPILDASIARWRARVAGRCVSA